MMRKITKTIALICIAAISTSAALAGCAGKTRTSQTLQTPDEVVAAYFTAVKAGDTAKMEQLTIPMDSSESSSASSETAAASSESESIYKAIYAKIDGQAEGKAKVSGNTASIKVKITAPDMKKIMTDEISKTFSTAISDAFSGSGPSGNDTSSQITADVMKELSQPDVSLATTEMNLQLTKQNGQWKIEGTKNFADALTGGLYSFGKDLSGSGTSSAN